MDDFVRIAQSCKRLADDLEGPGLRKITEKVAQLSKGDVLDQVGRDIGHDRKMGNWKVKFNARYDLTGEGEATIKGTPPGPWKVLEDGRKRTQLPKRKARKVYMTPLGPRTATKAKPFRIGATSGHNTFSKAQTTIKRELPGRVHQQTQALLRSYF